MLLEAFRNAPLKLIMSPRIGFSYVFYDVSCFCLITTSLYILNDIPIMHNTNAYPCILEYLIFKKQIDSKNAEGIVKS